MHALIDRLESRTLLSTTPPAFATDFAQLVSDAIAMKSAFQQHVPSWKADAKTLQADLKALPKTPHNGSALGKLRGDEGHWLAVLRGDMGQLVNHGVGQVHKLLTDGTRVVLHPNDAAAKARLAADVAALQATGGTYATKFLADADAARTAVFSDLDAITAANATNTTLGQHVQTAKADVNTLIDGAKSDYTTLQGDLGKLVLDLPATT